MRSAAAFDHDAAVRRGEVPRRPRRERLEDYGRGNPGERTSRDQEEERQGGGRMDHPNRFLHDPRDQDAGRGARREFDQGGGRAGRNAGGYGDGQGGRGAREERGGGGRRDEPYGRRSDVGTPKAHYTDIEEPPEWEYLDPSNVVQGPFSSEKLWTWYSGGYFPDTLQVREAGMDKFVSLKSVSHMVKQYVVASPPPPPSPQGAGRGRVPAVAAVRNDGPGEGRVGARRAAPYGRELYDANRGADRGPSETIKRQPREVPKVHPAYSLLSAEEQRKYEEVQQEAGGRPRGGVQQYTATAAEPPSRGGPAEWPRTAGQGTASVVQEPPPQRRPPPRAAVEPQQVPTPRAVPINPAPVFRARPESIARGTERQEPNRAGPGAEARGRGRGRGAPTPARAEPYVAGQRDGGAARARVAGDRAAKASNLAYPVELAKKLFQADATMASSYPVWWYIDPSQTVQGPFPATSMLTWYQDGYLHDMQLPTCGSERKVAPPNIPVKEQYVPLRELFEHVKSGKQFIPVTIQDIAAAKKAAEGKTKAGSEAKAGAKAGVNPPAPQAKGLPADAKAADSPKPKPGAAEAQLAPPAPTAASSQPLAPKADVETGKPGATGVSQGEVMPVGGNAPMDPAVKTLVANAFAAVAGGNGGVAAAPAGGAAALAEPSPAGRLNAANAEVAEPVGGKTEAGEAIEEAGDLESQRNEEEDVTQESADVEKEASENVEPKDVDEAGAMGSAHLTEEGKEPANAAPVEDVLPETTPVVQAPTDPAPTGEPPSASTPKPEDSKPAEEPAAEKPKTGITGFIGGLFGRRSTPKPEKPQESPRKSQAGVETIGPAGSHDSVPDVPGPPPKKDGTEGDDALAPASALGSAVAEAIAAPVAAVAVAAGVGAAALRGEDSTTSPKPTAMVASSGGLRDLISDGGEVGPGEGAEGAVVTRMGSLGKSGETEQPAEKGPSGSGLVKGRVAMFERSGGSDDGRTMSSPMRTASPMRKPGHPSTLSAPPAPVGPASYEAAPDAVEAGEATGDTPGTKEDVSEAVEQGGLVSDPAADILPSSGGEDAPHVMKEAGDGEVEPEGQGDEEFLEASEEHPETEIGGEGASLAQDEPEEEPRAGVPPASEGNEEGSNLMSAEDRAPSADVTTTANPKSPAASSVAVSSDVKLADEDDEAAVAGLAKDSKAAEEVEDGGVAVASETPEKPKEVGAEDPQEGEPAAAPAERTEGGDVPPSKEEGSGGETGVIDPEEKLSVEAVEDTEGEATDDGRREVASLVANVFASIVGKH